MPDHCAYCGVEGGDLRPCETCNRLVCWHPTCRNSKNKKTVCCTCAGKLPETSEGNDDWKNGTCPICDHETDFEGKIEVTLDNVSLPAMKYECYRGHIIIVLDHGHSTALKKGG